MKSYTLILISLSILNSCCRLECEEPANWGVPKVPYNNDLELSFISDAGNITTLNLEESEFFNEPTGMAKCYCEGQIFYNARFEYLDEAPYLNITFESESGGSGNEDHIIKPDQLAFSFHQTDFTCDLETNNFEPGQYTEMNEIEVHSLNDSTDIENVWQFINQVSEVPEVYYSVELGLIQFTSLDETIWRRIL